MGKKKVINDDPRFAALLDAVKKFHEDQSDNEDKLHVKQIVMSLAPEVNNPCNGKTCRSGFHPEIFIDPNTGDVSCRCVKN
ncbi:hypothetical protein OCK74_12070 [Chitinophagaceae bacterium LB-8]|uniref:Uncharacterized protein n=1 Tax=Paraflavisolibacter caeni TaxID=2982496 RepID=A0A9X2XYA3_9BACT|nr:hypothetical protein [Paraflavisolibacter caeni]MCU7549858.1 hypothetical protein [Paraflavisolibacter caeni]